MIHDILKDIRFRFCEIINRIREAFKYYFADFVRKGGGSTPPIRAPLSAENFSVKGGWGVPPISVTYFLDQSQVFLSKQHIF